MCGIIAVTGKNAHKHVITQYEEQYTRGNEGFGFIALKQNRIVQFSRSTEETPIVKALTVAAERNPDTILFHHRMPTSTINVMEAAHPLPIVHDTWANNYYILHNGIINGVDAEMTEISKKGYAFGSRVEKVSHYRVGKQRYEVVDDEEVNDSEVLGFYVAELLEGVRKDIPVLGAIAAIVVQESKKTGYCRTYVMRNYGNPLEMYRDKANGYVIIASEVKGASVPAQRLLRLTEKGTLREVIKLPIGKSFTEEMTPASYAGWGYGGYSPPYSAPADEDGAPRPKSVSDYVADTKKWLTETQKRDKRNDSERAVIAQAIGAAQAAADLAYTDYEESLDMFDNPNLTTSEADKVEAEACIAEFRDIWIRREEELCQLREDNGIEYDSTRDRDRATIAG